MLNSFCMLPNTMMLHVRAISYTCYSPPPPSECYRSIVCWFLTGTSYRHRSFNERQYTFIVDQWDQFIETACVHRGRATSWDERPRPPQQSNQLLGIRKQRLPTRILSTPNTTTKQSCMNSCITFSRSTKPSHEWTVSRCLHRYNALCKYSSLASTF